MNTKDTGRAKKIAGMMKMIPRDRFSQIFIKDITKEIQERAKKEKLTQEQLVGYYLSEPAFVRIIEYAGFSRADFATLCEVKALAEVKLTFLQKIRYLLPF